LYVNAVLYDAAGAALTLASDMTVGSAFGTSGPGIVGSYKDFDGSALPTTANVNTEEEAVPFAASIVGVQYVMSTNEDGSKTVFVDEDVASAAADLLVKIGGIRDDTLDARSTTEGDWEMFHMNVNGALWTIDVNSIAAAASLALLDDTIFADETNFTYATTKVQVMGAVAESTTDTLADNAIGAPVMTLSRFLRVTPSGYATGGAAPIRIISDASDNDDETAVCTADCTVYSIAAFNHAATTAFLRCEADTAGNTTPGSETASAGEFDLEIPGATTGAGMVVTFPMGVSYTTALTCWLATGEAVTDATDPGDADVRVFITRVQ
jgi:hypothetical protein